jgi:hypothetical protein
VTCIVMEAATMVAAGSIDEKSPVPGAGPDPEDAADAARLPCTAHPWLSPAPDQFRRVGGGHRQRHRRLQAPASSPGVPAGPQQVDRAYPRLVRQHRETSDPPLNQDPRVHHRLERPLLSLRLDQSACRSSRKQTVTQFQKRLIRTPARKSHLRVPLPGDAPHSETFYLAR